MTRRPLGTARRAVVIVLVLAALGGLALVVLRGPGGSSNPEQLAVGDCFDLPASTDRIGDLRHRGCSGAHGGEVFHVYDAASTAEAGYPTDSAWESLVYPVCDPAFESYTGSPVAERLDIEYRYLVPTADRWASGDRQVTCFIISSDGSPLDRSLRAAP